MSFDVAFMWKALQVIIDAIPLTLIITITPLLIGFLIALIVTLIRLNGVKVLMPIANFYVSFYRGTPVIMHIFLVYFGVPKIADYYFNVSLNAVPIAVFVIIALSLNAGAFLSEIIRSGILSVQKGQVEAAYSLGMSAPQVFQRIIFPQAFVTIIPNLTSMFIGFLHASSIAFLVSVKEMTGAANIIAASNLKYLEAFIAAGIAYWVLSLLIEFVAAKVETRLSRYLRRGVVKAA